MNDLLFSVSCSTHVVQCACISRPASTLIMVSVWAERSISTDDRLFVPYIAIQMIFVLFLQPPSVFFHKLQQFLRPTCTRCKLVNIRFNARAQRLNRYSASLEALPHPARLPSANPCLSLINPLLICHYLHPLLHFTPPLVPT